MTLTAPTSQILPSILSSALGIFNELTINDDDDDDSDDDNDSDENEDSDGYDSDDSYDNTAVMNDKSYPSVQYIYR